MTTAQLRGPWDHYDVEADVLAAIASFGVVPDENGRVTLYHATTQAAAPVILETLALRPPPAAAEDDPAVRRLLERSGGSVYLSTSPNIREDLADGEVLLEVVVDSNLEAEIHREAFNGRAELVVELRLPEAAVPLISAERLP